MTDESIGRQHVEQGGALSAEHGAAFHPAPQNNGGGSSRLRCLAIEIPFVRTGRRP